MLVHHLNCGYLHAPPNPKVGCHCLLLQEGDRLALVDTGMGLDDVRAPVERFGQTLIDLAGFQFREQDTAVRQIEALGLDPAQVTDIVLTHGDPDHAGGLADFPAARVHICDRERAAIEAKGPRYLPIQFAHGPRWQDVTSFPDRWYGVPAAPIPLGFGEPVLVVQLHGHALGHCGVAVRQGDRWLLHVGDAYYLRVELETDDHPVSQLAAIRADDDPARRANLEHLRRIHREHPTEVTMFGYHDLGERSP